MSKVYSFRLSDDNPREGQAREVIEAWVEEGYSLRHMIVEALISYNKEEIGQGELTLVIEQLQDLILSMDKQSFNQTSNGYLSKSFLKAVRQSAKQGVREDTS